MIYKIEGGALRVLLSQLGADPDSLRHDGVQYLRVAVDDGLRFKVNEQGWTQPLGDREPAAWICEECGNTITQDGTIGPDHKEDCVFHDPDTTMCEDRCGLHVDHVGRCKER